MAVRSVVSFDDMQKVLSEVGDGYVIVDFYASWCGPCRTMGPVFEELATTYAGKATFVKVDVDLAEPLIMEYSIRAMPTFVIIKGQDGKVDELIGASREKLLRLIQKHLDAA